MTKQEQIEEMGKVMPEKIKDPLDNSRYIIFMPNTEIITVSKKIEDKQEKERLIEIVKKYLPKNCGAIIRTSAKDQDEKKIRNDVEVASKKWDEIKKAYDESVKQNK